MKIHFLNCNKNGVFQFTALLLLGYSLAGCASPISSSPAPQSGITGEGQNAKAQTTRAVIYFQRPTADNSVLSAAISNACLCTPVFFQSYGSDGLIYVITLPQGRDFADFEKALMQWAPQLGITSVEQDRLMHIQ
jgi:hypothetical protein